MTQKAQTAKKKVNWILSKFKDTFVHHRTPSRK